MELKNKKVLVTGAGGFIGSHLTERLVEMNAEVRAFVRYNSRNDYGLLEMLPLHIRQKIDIVTGDLKDPDAVEWAANGVNVIFHLGALIAIPYSYINPRDAVETNVIGTLNVLNAARKHNIEKLIHTSSSEVYGTAQYIPIDEKHPLQAQSPYAASKIGADKLVESYYLSYDLPVAIVRPFNTYGPRQSARAVLPTIITQALTKDKILLGAMHPIRDFVYVEDTVYAFIKTAESDKSIGNVFNFGTGHGISIADVADMIISLVGREVKIEFDATRIRPEKSEVERLEADASKAMKLLDWRPGNSLEDGLTKTIQWFSESIDGYKPGIYII